MIASRPQRRRASGRANEARVRRRAAIILAGTAPAAIARGYPFLISSCGRGTIPSASKHSQLGTVVFEESRFRDGRRPTAPALSQQPPHGCPRCTSNRRKGYFWLARRKKRESERCRWFPPQIWFFLGCPKTATIAPYFVGTFEETRVQHRHYRRTHMKSVKRITTGFWSTMEPTTAHRLPPPNTHSRM
jgi:hypothetical protein